MRGGGGGGEIRKKKPQKYRLGLKFHTLRGARQFYKPIHSLTLTFFGSIPLKVPRRVNTLSSSRWDQNLFFSL